MNDDPLKRAIEATRHAPPPWVRGASSEKVRQLRADHAAGRGRTEKLTHESGKPMFIFGVTPMTDDYYI